MAHATGNLSTETTQKQIVRRELKLLHAGSCANRTLRYPSRSTRRKAGNGGNALKTHFLWPEDQARESHREFVCVGRGGVSPHRTVPQLHLIRDRARSSVHTSFCVCPSVPRAASQEHLAHRRGPREARGQRQDKAGPRASAIGVQFTAQTHGQE